MMEDGGSTVRKWEDLEIDVLVKIFQEINIVELTLDVSRVCSSWRSACSDPLLWETFDLGLLKSNFIKIPLLPHVWVDERSDKKLMQILKVAMRLSHGSVTSIIFHFNLYPKDEHLIYVAERCPQLKRLVLPGWNRLTNGGILTAIRKWKDLESATVPSYPSYIIEEIGINCKNLKELKIMGVCDVCFALTITDFLPRLKVLSLRCTILVKEALLTILDSLEQLEVLNISHCLLVEFLSNYEPRNVFWELDETIIKKASRLRAFYYCLEDSCVVCQRMIADEGLMRWYIYERDSWRTDEVRVLAH